MTRGLEARTWTAPDGAAVAYRRRPGRPCWILLHGLGCDAAMWEDVVAALPASWGLLAPDLRGHGGSDIGWPLPSVDLWARDVAGIARTEGVREASVAGLSMGGYTALALAALDALGVRSFAFLDTHAGADDDAARQRRAAGLRVLHREGWEPFARGLAEKIFPPRTEASHPWRRQFMEMAARAGTAGLAAAVQALANRPDRRAILGTLEVPSLVLVGDQDALVPVDTARAMAEALPRGRLVVVEGVAHMSAMERPDAVARALEEATP